MRFFDMTIMPIHYASKFCCLLTALLTMASCTRTGTVQEVCNAINDNQDSTVVDIDFLEFVKVPKGKKMIGTNNSMATDHEKPQSTIIIKHDFYITKYEVRVRQFKLVAGDGFPSNREEYAAKVSWHEANWYCEQLNLRREKQGFEQGVYRLPYEYEWEYMATYSRPFSDDWWPSYTGIISDLDLFDQEYFSDTADGKFHPSGQLAPNKLGAYDLLGNYSEWCNGYLTDNVSDMIAKKYEVLDWPLNWRPIRGSSISHDITKLRPSIRRARQQHQSYAFRVLFAPHEKLQNRISHAEKEWKVPFWARGSEN